jgi:hypothetical protein
MLPFRNHSQHLEGGHFTMGSQPLWRCVLGLPAMPTMLWGRHSHSGRPARGYANGRRARAQEVATAEGLAVVKRILGTTEQMLAGAQFEGAEATRGPSWLCATPRARSAGTGRLECARAPYGRAHNFEPKSAMLGMPGDVHLPDGPCGSRSRDRFHGRL